MPLTHAPAIEHHPIASRKGRIAALSHGARQINPGNQRPDPGDRAFASDRQAILIVERGVGDIDSDVAIGQRGIVKTLHRHALAGFGLVDDDCGKHGLVPEFDVCVFDARVSRAWPQYLRCIALSAQAQHSTTKRNRSGDYAR